MAETFTLKKDINNIPVCAYQIGANALNYLAWVAVQVVDDTQTTDANGVFTAASKPIVDSNGDGDITAIDVLPRRTDTGASLYVGTDEGEVNSNTGEITLYTDEALTVPAASLEVKCTYWTLVPLAVDSSGRLILAPTSSVEISGSALPTGAATEVTLATLATEATLQTIATQVTLAAVETILTAIKDTAGIKKIVDALPAGTNKLGLMGVTNSDGSRHAHVHNSLGDAEDFTESLSSSAFLLTYDAVAGKWKRFKVSDITDILTSIKDTDGIKKITDTVNVALTGSSVLDTAAVSVKSVQKVLTTTIINAVSVAAGGNTGYVSCGTDGTEDEVWLAINIDKQPWTVYTRSFLNAANTKANYPEINSKATAYATSTLPCMTLLIGVVPSFQGLSDPTTIQTAKELIVPHSGHQAYVLNGHATDNATITVKVLRIWR